VTQICLNRVSCHLQVLDYQRLSLAIYNLGYPLSTLPVAPTMGLLAENPPLNSMACFSANIDIKFEDLCLRLLVLHHRLPWCPSRQPCRSCDADDFAIHADRVMPRRQEVQLRHNPQTRRNMDAQVESYFNTTQTRFPIGLKNSTTVY